VQLYIEIKCKHKVPLARTGPTNIRQEMCFFRNQIRQTKLWSRQDEILEKSRWKPRIVATINLEIEDKILVFWQIEPLRFQTLVLRRTNPSWPIVSRCTNFAFLSPQSPFRPSEQLVEFSHSPNRSFPSSTFQPDLGYYQRLIWTEN